jgi:hypothetical protein
VYDIGDGGKDRVGNCDDGCRDGVYNSGRFHLPNSASIYDIILAGVIILEDEELEDEPDEELLLELAGEAIAPMISSKFLWWS